MGEKYRPHDKLPDDAPDIPLTRLEIDIITKINNTELNLSELSKLVVNHHNQNMYRYDIHL